MLRQPAKTKLTALECWGWKCSCLNFQWVVHVCLHTAKLLLPTTMCHREIMGTPSVRILCHGGKSGRLFLWFSFEPPLEWRNYWTNIMCCKMPDFYFIKKKMVQKTPRSATDICRTKLHILAHSTTFNKSEPEPFPTCHQPTWELICYPTAAIFHEHTSWHKHKFQILKTSC